MNVLVMILANEHARHGWLKATRHRCRKDDRHGLGCGLGRQCRSSAAGTNHGHLTMNQIGRHRREPITSAFNYGHRERELLRRQEHARKDRAPR
jgi:hypothetical protein